MENVHSMIEWVEASITAERRERKLTAIRSLLRDVDEEHETRSSRIDHLTTVFERLLSPH
jgi:hypothetical protein